MVDPLRPRPVTTPATSAPDAAAPLAAPGRRPLGASDHFDIGVTAPVGAPPSTEGVAGALGVPGQVAAGTGTGRVIPVDLPLYAAGQRTAVTTARRVGDGREYAGAYQEIAANGPTVLESASPLFRAIVTAARGTTAPGTVPNELQLTNRNFASPRVLHDAGEVFRGYRELIEDARHDVAIQTFAWDINSDPVNEVFTALKNLQAKRQAEGATEPIKVRFMVDAMRDGMQENPPSDELIEQVTIRCLHEGLDRRFVDVEVGLYEHTLAGSLHSKALVVDGRAGIITGCNMNNWDDFEKGEHDAGFVVGGDVALSMLADFDEGWTRSKRWAAPPFINVGSIAPIPTSGRVPAEELLRPTLPIQHTVVRGELSPDARPVPMMVVGKQAHDGIRPGMEGYYPLNAAVLAALYGADREVKMRSPNLNAREVKDGIVHAIVERHVKVKLILAKKYEEWTESLPFQEGPNAPNVAELYRQVAQELEKRGDPRARNLRDWLDIRWYRNAASDAGPVEGNSANASHVKFMAIDDQVAFPMSLNFDTQSWHSSREVGLVVDDAKTTKQWAAQMFDNDFVKGVPATFAGE